MVTEEMFLVVLEVEVGRTRRPASVRVAYLVITIVAMIRALHRVLKHGGSQRRLDVLLDRYHLRNEGGENGNARSNEMC